MAASTRNVFVCTICKSFGARSYKSVLSHIGNIHTFGPSREIQCGIDGCPASYKTESFNSFRSHVYRKHRDVLFTANEENIPPDHGEDESESSSYQPINDGMDDNDQDQMLVGPTMKRAAAVFLLKTLEERKITQTALNGIMSDCQALLEIILSLIHI